MIRDGNILVVDIFNRLVLVLLPFFVSSGQLSFPVKTCLSYFMVSFKLKIDFCKNFEKKCDLGGQNF